MRVAHAARVLSNLNSSKQESVRLGPLALTHEEKEEEEAQKRADRGWR